MNFFYEATDQSGQTVLGKIEAVNAADVQRKLLRLGYRPRSIALNSGSTDPADQAVASTATAPSIAQSAAQSLVAQSPPTSRGTRVASGTNLSQSFVSSQSMVGSRVTGARGVILAGNATHVARRQTATASPRALHPTGRTSPLGGVSTQDLMLFFRQAASLVHSGMSIFTALDNLAGRTPNPRLAQTVRAMANAARNGERISDVMAQYPRIFADHIVGTVRAGELGGFLEISLSEIALNYEQNIALYRGAWIPKLMATQAFFMFALVQPLFPTLFPEAQFALYLKLVLLRNLPITFGLYALIRWGGRQMQLPRWRRLRDSWSLLLPPFGVLQRQAALGAFIRMLRKLYQAGVAPIAAWEGAMNTASNVVIRDRLAASYTLMQGGASLPDAFTATGLFHSSIEQLLVTGHQSGQVVETLDTVAEYYQQQTGEAAGKARFMMLRLGILAMLILGGGTLLWMVHTYFGGMFKWIDDFMKEPGS